MIKYISTNISNSDYSEGKAWPFYEVVTDLHNGLRIIKNGIGRYVYALIDADDNLIIPYLDGQISAIEDTDFLKVSSRYPSGIRIFDTTSGIRIFDTKGNEIINTPYSTIEFVDDIFIVSKSNNGYGRNEKQLYGIYSLLGEIIYPVEYDSIIPITTNIYTLKKTKDGVFNPTLEKNFIWFAKENKEVDIPLGEIELLNEGFTLYIHPSKIEEEEQYHQAGSSGYLLLSSTGEILSPKNVLDIGTFNEDGFASISVRCEIFGIWHMDGIIDWCGNLYIHNNSDLIAMPKGYDWVSDYQNGIADTYNGKQIGHIDLNDQKVIKVHYGEDLRYILLPEKYSYGIDSECNFIKVVTDDLMGIINCDGSEIIPPIYLLINIVHDPKIDLYRFVCYKKEAAYIHEDYKGKYGVGHVDIYDNYGNKLNASPISNPSYLGFGLFRCDCVEEKIKRITPNYNGEYETLKFQIINSNCELISDIKFSEVLKFGESREYSDPHMEDENAPYAIFMRGDTWGTINATGEVVLIGVETQLKIKDIPALILEGCYSPDLHDLGNIKVPFQHNYKSVKYVGYGLFLVATNTSHLNDKWHKVGTSYVDITNRALAPLSGRVSDIKKSLFISSVWGDGIHLSAVINIHGEIIIPYCELQFEIYNNFILAKDKDYEPIIFSVQGEVIVPKGIYRNGHIFEDFLDRFIKITWNGGWAPTSILIDLKGNELYNDDFYDFEQIVPGILKIKGHYGYGTRIYLGDFYGNLLSEGYDNMEIFKNGLCVVAEKKKTGYNEYNGNDTYSNFYGVIRITGEIVVPVKYRSVKIFENENIIETSVGNMTYDGRFITFFDSPEGQTQLVLDSKYDYCLPFVDNYAIVYANDMCGIIDTLGKEIFPLICTQIVHLENSVYKIKICGKWGIFEIKNGLVISNKYSEIKEFNEGIAKVCYTQPGDVRYYGMISLKEELIKPQFSVIRILSPKIIACALGGESGYAAKWSLYDLNNRFPINLDKHISFIGEYSNELIRICMDGLPCRRKHGTSISGGRWGYMDINGRIHIDPKFEKCLDFLNDLGPVMLNNKWGFIDKSGNIVVPFDYDEVEKENSYYIGIKFEGKDKSWYRFNERGIIISQGEVEPDKSDDYDYETGYDETPSIYDNPYYNDNLDMDQQSIDFWNSL